MAYYGGPSVNINYVYVAVQPIQAEHPIGSGIVVTYNPGDTFPGEEWGNAAHNLVEVGKAVRLAINVENGGGSQSATPAPAVTSYPHHEGAGWFLLSDGSRVRGKEQAVAAQEELDHASN